MKGIPTRPTECPTPTMSIYESRLKQQNISTQSKLLHVRTDTFGHIRWDKYAKIKNFDRNIDVSEDISD